MKLRVARHTSDLKSLINFYTIIVGLEVIGDFKDHAGYNGVFIGGKNTGWHLEFTTSAHAANHQADDDDLLVFYVDEEDYNNIRTNAAANNIRQVEAKNPYWAANGFKLPDPDGFRVVITMC
ncbi:VOC family protein [Mucilaginibacter sp. UR6-11]|uniref:VOC family protein n=1 Tax=Mucilaginibacter sp. UR6-11 TaxID=1435644 RepID=UPI001E2E5799|nr:VOC family protein [Mucilaginibacter sp. UR6-11]MCC8424252.1 VOC family protein [Mucilaginibacter sp. UR6-11]